MVAVGFTKLKEKILSGEKTQTIRRWSEHYARLWPGAKLHLYWKLRTKECELLFVTHLKHSIGPLKFSEFTEELAVADGFNNLAEMQEAFREMYKHADDQEYIVLVWEKLPNMQQVFFVQPDGSVPGLNAMKEKKDNVETISE